MLSAYCPGRVPGPQPYPASRPPHIITTGPLNKRSRCAYGQSLYARLLCEFVFFTLQVKKIAPVFQLQASTVYLVREFENIAVFPHEASGRFNRALIDLSPIYAVHGEDMVSATPQATATPGPSVPSVPFGAYTGPTLSRGVPCKAISKKPNSFRKTIALVSLTADNRPSTSTGLEIQHKIISQLVVSIEVGRCSLATKDFFYSTTYVIAVYPALVLVFCLHLYITVFV